MDILSEAQFTANLELEHAASYEDAIEGFCPIPEPPSTPILA